MISPAFSTRTSRSCSASHSCQFVEVRREAVARKTLERGNQAREQRGDDGVAIGHGRAMRANVVGGVAGGFHGGARVVVERDVEADADDHVHGPAGLGAHLDENAAELAAARSPGRWAISAARRARRARSAHSRRTSPTTSDSADRSAGMSAYCHAERQADGAAGRRDPAAAAPAASAGLVFGEHHRGGARRRRQRL